MKKFIASENIAIATSRKFKESINLACLDTERELQFGSSRYETSFVGTVVTFNHKNSEVNTFNFKSNVDCSNKKEFNKSLNSFLNRISIIEKYSDNEYVTFINSSQFAYHGYVGYKSEKEQEIENMKFENVFMKTYIDIITNNVDDIIVDNSPLLEEFNLSPRTLNCLNNANINTYNDLKDLTLVDISKVKGLGTNSLNELEKVLKINFL